VEYLQALAFAEDWT